MDHLNTSVSLQPKKASMNYPFLSWCPCRYILSKTSQHKVLCSGVVTAAFRRRTHQTNHHIFQGNQNEVHMVILYLSGSSKVSCEKPTKKERCPIDLEVPNLQCPATSTIVRKLQHYDPRKRSIPLRLIQQSCLPEWKQTKRKEFCIFHLFRAKKQLKLSLIQKMLIVIVCQKKLGNVCQQQHQTTASNRQNYIERVARRDRDEHSQESLKPPTAILASSK